MFKRGVRVPLTFGHLTPLDYAAKSGVDGSQSIDFAREVIASLKIWRFIQRSHKGKGGWLFGLRTCINAQEVRVGFSKFKSA